jgi:hypothetical protein
MYPTLTDEQCDQAYIVWLKLKRFIRRAQRRRVLVEKVERSRLQLVAIDQKLAALDCAVARSRPSVAEPLEPLQQFEYLEVGDKVRVHKANAAYRVGFESKILAISAAGFVQLAGNCWIEAGSVELVE